MVLRIARSAFHFAGTSIHLACPVNAFGVPIGKMRASPLKGTITFTSLRAMSVRVNNGVELLCERLK